MIREFVQRISARPAAADDPRVLKAEVERLRSQNDNMKRAMRHCLDCEYRVEVMANRAAQGRVAGGGETAD